MPRSALPALASAENLRNLGAIARAIIRGKIPPLSSATGLLDGFGLVYGELRASGRLIISSWESKSNFGESFCSILQNMRQLGGHELLVCFCANEKALRDDGAWKHATANIQRGLKAFSIGSSQLSQVLHVSPFTQIAQNRPLNKFLPEVSADPSPGSDTTARRIAVSAFDAEQFYIDLRADVAARWLFRCGQLVPLENITRATVEELDKLLSRFLIRSVHPDGRMTYLYYPSRGTEDRTKNNSIRQWMATRALCHLWRRTHDQTLSEMIARNIAYNLTQMYREENGLGLITDGPKIKLGAIALAALALRESPTSADYESVYQSLLAAVDSLWRESGEFRTFYAPIDRTDCQNFYPGEALLLWSEVLRDFPTGSLRGRFWRSFEFYQTWHLANRNPAFIPWHTQAYFNVWKLTRDARLADAIFRMNDWLLDVQQWDTAPSLDCRGRFYDPHRPFGPPHASSTGVYLEGLADAFALAKELGDVSRAVGYRRVILRGLRSIAQLTFKDDLDMFYVTKRDRLRGGVRTTEYDNVVRIDNVQHSLMAVHKVLDAFAEEDFQSPS